MARNACCSGYRNITQDDMEVTIMHQLFFFSPCNYMQAGLKVVMEGAPVRVITVVRPEDILSTPQPRGNRMVLVSVPAREPKVAARASLFLWQLMSLQAAGHLPEVFCLLLSDIPDKKFSCLKENLTAVSLRNRLLEAVTRPGRHRLNPQRQCELSALQEKILTASLAGASVDEMARMLNISKRGVFAGRAALMHKLGVKNRLGLMGLTGRDVM
ncbi:hypothetical protein E5475_20745 [Salmonella enterica]|nr:hypothetical protein [Salmonella enterica]